MKMRALLIYLCIILAVICKFPEAVSSNEGVQASFGALAYADATTLFQQRSFDEASEAFWKAIMKHSIDDPFTIEDAYKGFMGCYAAKGKLDEGYVYIGDQHNARQQSREAAGFFQSAVELNPRNIVAILRLAEGINSDTEDGKKKKLDYLKTAFEIDPKNAKVNHMLGHFLFELKQFKGAQEHFDLAFKLDEKLVEAAASAIYLRFSICNWGKNGTQYRNDIKALTDIATAERDRLLLYNKSHEVSVIHPHMALGYAINSEHKLAISKSYAENEKVIAVWSGLKIFDDTSEESRSQYRSESQKAGFRIKVGYVSANIKSKTTVYMAQDLMRLHDRTKFEIHVFATTPPDNAQFLKISMKGVDWRKKIKNSVEHFHDTSSLNANQTASLIRSLGIHILLNWDGYSNEGVRVAGLFPLQSAPLQVAHQEYIGTMGADYIQYLITDPVASPLEYSKFYSEKFIYMPHSFLANSFAYQQPDMKTASMVLPNNDNPSKNRCSIMLDIGNSNDNNDDDGDDGANQSPKSFEKESFIFCNFNKHLKFDPDLFSHWLNTLQAVDNSYLCLLENPKESKEFITEFTKNHSPNLVKRIGYLPFINNPYENQQRNARYCHVILDTTIYNGHTTAADALWGGVPVVTRGDGVDMGSRVGASILTALNLPELIGSDQENYNDIALKLALDKEFYAETRSKLIQANHAKAPMNPFWDLQRYVRNLESGFESIWDTFIHGRDVEHVHVVDSGSSGGGVEGSDSYRAVIDHIEDREDAPLILESNTYKNTLESVIKKPRNTAAKKQKKKQSTKEKKSAKNRQRSKRKRRRKSGRSRRRSLSEEL